MLVNSFSFLPFPNFDFEIADSKAHSAPLEESKEDCSYYSDYSDSIDQEESDSEECSYSLTQKATSYPSYAEQLDSSDDKKSSEDEGLGDFQEVCLTASQENRIVSNYQSPSKRLYYHIRRIFKGCNSTSKAKPMNPTYWMETVNKHYRGDFLEKYITIWQKSQTRLSLPEWLEYQNIENREAYQLHYFDKKEKMAHKLTIQGSTCYFQNEKLDTRTMKSSLSGSGYAMLVISNDQQLYVANHIPYKIHHSSLTSGEGVIFAGEIQTDEKGHILRLTNKSGHYRLDEESCLKMLTILKQEGIDLSTIELDVWYDNLVITYSSADEFLNAKGNICPSLINGNMRLAKREDGGIDLHISDHFLYETIIKILRKLESKSIDLEKLYIQHSIDFLSNPTTGAFFLEFFETEEN